MKDKLLEAAIQARKNAYAPYSNFKVGAALKAKSGSIYQGCNIENASFSLTCCAERTAIFNGITAGETAFQEMVVIADTRDAVSPCGACRQVMAEFFSEDVAIRLKNLNGRSIDTTVEELLPFYFKL